MLKLTKRYRRFYRGEDIVVERNYTDGVWHDTTENVPNAVINNQISNQAVVIGNGPSRLSFNLNLIKNHRGGLYGSRTLQSYGCNALYRDFTPDFLVASGNNGIVEEIANSEYTKDNIVYTNSLHTLEYPGKFYLIPHDPYADAGTTAAYIAAFDGHKNIYLLGFDQQDAPGHNYNVYAGTANYDLLKSTVSDARWRSNFRNLASVYNDVNFAFVYPKNTYPLPEQYKGLTNVRVISFNQFALEADL